MPGYGQFCPIARASEILATRWTPIIVRNLLMGCRSFTEIRDGAPGISRTVLSERLRTLEHYGVVERRDSGYALTEAGEALWPVVEALGIWGERWLELAPEHYQASTVLWALCRQLEDDDLPDDGRTVVRFDVPDDERRRYWLVVQRPDPEVCSKPPGYDEDGVVRTSSEWLTKWYQGRIGLGDALNAGLITVTGPRDLERALARWGGRGGFEPQPLALDALPRRATASTV